MVLVVVAGTRKDSTTRLEEESRETPKTPTMPRKDQPPDAVLVGQGPRIDADLGRFRRQTPPTSGLVIVVVVDIAHPQASFPR